MKFILALIIFFSTTQAVFSNELSSEEREIISIERRLDPASAVAFNLIPFGVGSFMQGDHVSGTAISIIDLTGLFVLLSFASTALLPPCNYCPLSPPTSLLGFGFAGFTYLFGRVLGIVAPYLYDSQFNEKTMKDLNTREQPQLWSYSFQF